MKILDRRIETENGKDKANSFHDRRCCFQLTLIYLGKACIYLLPTPSYVRVAQTEVFSHDSIIMRTIHNRLVNNNRVI